MTQFLLFILKLIVETVFKVSALKLNKDFLFGLPLFRRGNEGEAGEQI